MLLAALSFALAVDAAILEKLGSALSTERESGDYALARLYDPELFRDRELVDRAFGASSGGERAALARGMADRDFGGPLPRELESKMAAALGDIDPGVRIAAVEFLERVPPEHARARTVEQLTAVRGSVDGPRVAQALFALVERNPDRSLKAPMEETAGWLFGAVVQQAQPLFDGGNARAIAVLAALGEKVEPLLPVEERSGAKESKSDYWRTARANAVRAAGGDVAALSALVEDAATAIDPKLRRESADLLEALPPAPRLKALSALAGKPREPDWILRTALVRAWAREAPAPALDAALLRTLHDDPDPDLQFIAAAALGDHAGKLSADDAASLASESAADPLVRAALRIAQARLPAATPVPSASPSPSARASPAASTSASATPTPEPSWTPHPFPYPSATPPHRPN